MTTFCAFVWSYQRLIIYKLNSELEDRLGNAKCKTGVTFSMYITTVQNLSLVANDHQVLIKDIESGVLV